MLAACRLAGLSALDSGLCEQTCSCATVGDCGGRHGCWNRLRTLQRRSLAGFSAPAAPEHRQMAKAASAPSVSAIRGNSGHFPPRPCHRASKRSRSAAQLAGRNVR